MTTRILLVALACFAPAIVATAANPSDANAASGPAAAAPAGSATDELKPLIERINEKIRSGVRTESALADELKQFDALVAAHKGEKTEDAAMISMMRASLYLEVFEDYDKGATLLRQLKADFPGTEAAKNVDGALAQINLMKESLSTRAALKPGAPFPDFAEKDLSGAPLSIGRFKGKVVLVDFWATWCGPCVAELPNVLAAYEKYHGKGFEVVGISLDDNEQRLRTFIADRKMAWPQYFDGKGWESKLGRKYGVNSIPATYLLDGDGKIVAKDLRGEDLNAQLEKMLTK